jgi:hypothetical protein
MATTTSQQPFQSSSGYIPGANIRPLLPAAVRREAPIRTERVQYQPVYRENVVNMERMEVQPIVEREREVEVMTSE